MQEINNEFDNRFDPRYLTITTTMTKTTATVIAQRIIADISVILSCEYISVLMFIFQRIFHSHLPLKVIMQNKNKTPKF